MSRRIPLMLQIVTADPRPINRQIVDGVRRLIASDELPVGAALPSVLSPSRAELARFLVL